MSTLAEKTSKYESLAKEFLATKERQKYYQFECESDEGLSGSDYLPLTDDDIAEIKEIIMDGYKKYYMEEPSDGEERPLPSFEEVLKEIDLYDFEGDEDLDSLIFKHIQFTDFYDPNHVVSMDLEHPHYYYQTTCIGYNKEKKEPRYPMKVKVQLTDEEYIYLLTQNLLEKGFTFNRLIMLRPELAQKINLQIDGCYFDYNIKWEEPFLVVFDEINADAEKIREKENL